MRVILLGPPLCGKSTVGKKIARLLNLKFIDTDTVFEQLTETTVSEFFSSHTEEEFRFLERQALLSVIDEEDILLASGGGLPCYCDNMELLKQKGITVYLKMSPESIFFRLQNAKKERPLLQQGDKTEIMKKITEMLSNREQYYSQAQIIIKAENIDINTLVSVIREQKNEI